ncbi:MAG: isoprenoid biosynthesis protein with amidotransferase-like domain [Myxococcales bacterium]|nr:isoprenoid biosynthesis protein with amidotransferase-like domain [Myxococcales bacterium]
MARRVAVILSGCGHRDGSDVAETMLAFLMLDRAGAQVVCAAPDVEQREVVDHLHDLSAGSISTPTASAMLGAPRNARVEAARLAPGDVLPLSALDPNRLEGLLIPSGRGVVTTLSDYFEKGALCAVDPDLARVMKALIGSKKPMGFVGLAAVLAARVLGPVAGVRLTLGSKAVVAAKHAAIMGGDVRPGSIDDVIVDEKNRIYSTPGLEAEGARLAQVAKAIEKMARALTSAPRQLPRREGPPSRPVPDRPRFEPKPSGVDPLRRPRS